MPCYNSCGYYGNEKHFGYCSKCYKDMLAKEVLATKSDQSGGYQLPSTNWESNVKANNLVLSSSEGKSSVKKKKIDPKQTSQKIPANVTKPKTVMKHQSAIVSNLTSFLGMKPQRPGQAQQLPPTVQSGSKKRVDFAAILKNPSFKEFVEYFNGTAQKLCRESVMTPDEYSDLVQDVYESTESKYRNHPVFREYSAEDWEAFMDGVEKTLMTRLYAKVFDMPSSEEFGKDWLLSRKISLLWWVEPSHLDITLDLDRGDVTHRLEDAKRELLRMDARKSPQDKLICLCKCCEMIFSALKASNDGPASADDFLPAMIYLILVTNPPRLHANVNYIQRFSCPRHVTSGETGYYLTNLVGTVSFIEQVTHENLNISEEEYNRKMGIVAGHSILDAILACKHPKRHDKNMIGEIESKLQELRDWSTQQHLLQVEASEWRQEMAEFRDGLRDQVENTLLGTPNMTQWGPT